MCDQLQTFFSLAGGSQHRQLSGSNQSGVYVPPSGEGLSMCKTAQRTRLRILSVAPEKQLKGLDFV